MLAASASWRHCIENHTRVLKSIGLSHLVYYDVESRVNNDVESRDISVVFGLGSISGMFTIFSRVVSECNHDFALYLTIIFHDVATDVMQGVHEVGCHASV